MVVTGGPVEAVLSMMCSIVLLFAIDPETCSSLEAREPLLLTPMNSFSLR